MGPAPHLGQCLPGDQHRSKGLRRSEDLFHQRDLKVHLLGITANALQVVGVIFQQPVTLHSFQPSTKSFGIAGDQLLRKQ